MWAMMQKLRIFFTRGSFFQLQRYENRHEKTIAAAWRHTPFYRAKVGAAAWLEIGRWTTLAEAHATSGTLQWLFLAPVHLFFPYSCMLPTLLRPYSAALLLLPLLAATRPQQAPTLSVKATTTGAPVPYASVGVQGKPIGTVADAQGRFFPHQLATAAPTDTVVVSCVGYHAYKVLAAELPRHTEIRLTPHAQQLAEVRVRATSWKRHRLGRDGAWGITYYNFHLATDKTTASIPGREVGSILHVPPGSYLEDAHVYFGQRNYRNLRFRLNVRALDDADHPAASLLTQDVQFAVPNDAPRGWQHIDLKPYQICVGNNKRIAVTLEWLEGVEARDHKDANQWNILLIPVALSATHRMVFRDKSEDQWKVQPANLSLYVTALSPRD